MFKGHFEMFLPSKRTVLHTFIVNNLLIFKDFGLVSLFIAILTLMVKLMPNPLLLNICGPIRIISRLKIKSLINLLQPLLM